MRCNSCHFVLRGALNMAMQQGVIEERRTQA